MKFFARRRYLPFVSAGLLVLSLFLPVIWSVFIEPNRLVVNSVSLKLDRWPSSLDGLRIAVVSDLHVGSPYIDNDKLTLIVGKINASHPDLILMLGDFVIQGIRGGHFVDPESIASALRQLHAPLGVFAVLGNHDWWLDGDRVKRALEKAGVEVLENDVTEIRATGGSFWLAGVADLWTRRPDIEGTLRKLPGNATVILLTHNPDIFPRIPERVALTLAGHTHGGQVDLPLLGRLVVPSAYGHRYAAGHVQEGSRNLYVTTGIGTSILPVRFRVPPEILVLTLHS
jgi:predicted MPP superfamily phosphohydrolase